MVRRMIWCGSRDLNPRSLAWKANVPMPPFRKDINTFFDSFILRLGACTDLTNIQSKSRFLLLGLPILLIASTATVFLLTNYFLEKDWSYVIGFAFYWAVWCYLIPSIMLGKQGFIGIFREKSPFFSKKNWYLIILLMGTIVGSVFMYYIPNFQTTPLPVILLAVPLSIIAGAGEEILWRGLYIKSFPNQLFLSFLYPTLWFSVQHVSSSLISWTAATPFFIALTLPLGLVYGLVSFKTESVRWNAIAHILISFFAFATPVSISLYHLI